MKETQARSLAKGLTYRCLATAATAFIAWIFTGNVTTALQVGAIDFVVKLIIYYANERFWTRIEWGYGAGFSRRYTRYRRLWRIKKRKLWN